jgi:demethylmenaquinone methyltransferase/2-methoxy-6-polyprenyl-1,4-benzoquinol methylase
LKRESSETLVKKFFENTADTYEKIVNLTTFRKDTYWKREIIKKISKCNSILDLACGTGILTFKIAEKFPEAKIVGVDVTESYLNVARKKLKPYHKISYCVSETLIEKCLTHLNSGGKIILHDFTYPQNMIVRVLWNLYFIMLKIAGYFMPDWKDVFENLPDLIKSSNWIEDYTNIMKRKGFQIEATYLTLGSSAILTGSKKI